MNEELGSRPDRDEIDEITDETELDTMLEAEYKRWQAQGFPHPNSIEWPQIEATTQLFGLTNLLIEKGICTYDEANLWKKKEKLKLMTMIYDEQIDTVRRARMGLPPDSQGPQVLGPDGRPIDNGNGPHI